MKNTIIVPDQHLPFELDGFLSFVKKVKKKYKCTQVLFTGDVIDNHAASYHESDPDGYSAGDELRLALDKVKDWYKAFPKAKVAVGNHDAMAKRKAVTAGLSGKWIRDYQEVLGTRGWDFKEIHKLPDLHLRHGMGMSAKNYAKTYGVNVAQGHRHSESYIEYFNSGGKVVWAMQLGCGFDEDCYAAAYGKHHKPCLINCGVVVNGIPMIIPFSA